jgi:hypothetical protein
MPAVVRVTVRQRAAALLRLLPDPLVLAPLLEDAGSEVLLNVIIDDVTSWDQPGRPRIGGDRSSGYRLSATVAALDAYDTYDRLLFLTALSTAVYGDTRIGVLAKGLAAAVAAPEKYRARGVAVLAPHLPEVLLSEALTVVATLNEDLPFALANPGSTA